MVDNKGKINDWDRMVAGKLYNAGSKDIFKQHALGLIRCQRFNKIAVWRFKTKQRALERLIPSAKGKDFAVFAPLYCEYGVNVHVGKDCFVNYNCTFLDISPITFGDGVWIGANVTLATPLHPFLVEERLPADYPDGRHDLVVPFLLPVAFPVLILFQLGHRRPMCWMVSAPMAQQRTMQ